MESSYRYHSSEYHRQGLGAAPPHIERGEAVPDQGLLLRRLDLRLIGNRRIVGNRNKAAADGAAVADLITSTRRRRPATDATPPGTRCALAQNRVLEWRPRGLDSDNRLGEVRSCVGAIQAAKRPRRARE